MQKLLKTRHTEFAYREEITGSKRIFDTHCHLSFELIAVYEGAVHIIVEGKRVELQPYHMAIIPPHLYHSVFSVKSGNYRRVTILFDRDLIPEQIREEVVTAIGEEPFYVHPFLKQMLDPLAEVLQMPEPERYGPLVESILVQILYHRIMYSSVGSLGESSLREFIAPSTMESNSGGYVYSLGTMLYSISPSSAVPIITVAESVSYPSSF